MKSIREYIIESSVRRYVDMLAVSKDGHVLVVRRANYMKRFHGLWGLPGGHVEGKKDVDTKEAAIREFQEETSILLNYDERNTMDRIGKMDHEDGSWTDVWRVVLRHDDPKVKISREHSKYEWIELTEESISKKKWMPGLDGFLYKYIKDVDHGTDAAEQGA